MRDAVDIPVTVSGIESVSIKLKTMTSSEIFVGTVSEAGTNVFIVHTRNAWLKGLSPKENREIPPLKESLHISLKRFP